MRLIDADALIDDVDGDLTDGVAERKAIEKIENAPTVDAVPVIRCRECKYKNEYGYCTAFLNFHHLTADMDYCSDAERRE